MAKRKRKHASQKEIDRASLVAHSSITNLIQVYNRILMRDYGWTVAQCNELMQAVQSEAQRKKAA